MHDLPDELLVIEVQAGSVFAFRILVERFEVRLLAFVHRIVNDQATAEEIVQDTFLKVYQTINRVDVEQRFSTYLFAIAKNTAISHLRRQHFEPSIETLPDLPSHQDLPAQADHRLLSERVRSALDRIAAPYRHVIELFYFDQLSYEEISKRLRLPLNTVRSRLRRGKGQLKYFLSHA